MRKVILAAALAATFTLPLRSQAQAGGGASATQDGAGMAPNTQAPAPNAGGAQGGPQATGSFSVPGQPQGMQGGGAQAGGQGLGVGGSGSAGQKPVGSALGPSQTLYGPSDQSSSTGGAGAATGTGDTGTESTVPGNVSGTSNVGSAGTAASGAGGNAAPDTVNARPTAVRPGSENDQVELAKLRAEVDRLRAELDHAKSRRGKSTQQDTGTGGSGNAAVSPPQPVASAVFEGRVHKVSKSSIEVIDHETGEPYVLHVTRSTRARRGAHRIPVTRIREGSEVRASFELISGDTYATRIDVLRKGRR